MKKRDSNIASFEGVPQLVIHYKKSMDKFYGVAPYIHKNVWSRFRVFEDDLRASDIAPKKYAYSIAKMLRGWAKDKGFDYIPTNAFLGEWALNKFMEVHESKYVDVQIDDEDEIIHSELLVARYYIESNVNGDFKRMSACVEDMRSMLSNKWLDIYESKGKRPLTKVLDILEDEFSVSNITSYNDIIDNSL